MCTRLLTLLLIALLSSNPVRAQFEVIALDDFHLSIQKPVGIERLGVVVFDQREQVTDGRQQPSLLGYHRSLTAVAYPVKIKGGESLAAWLSKRISESLEKNGVATINMRTVHNETWPQVMGRMKTTDVNRFIVLQLKKLQFDGTTSFSYMAELGVAAFNLQTQHPRFW